MSEKNVQGAPPSPHDVPHGAGDEHQAPNPQHIEQGTKPTESRDAGDHASNPPPSTKK